MVLWGQFFSWNKLAAFSTSKQKYLCLISVDGEYGQQEWLPFKHRYTEFFPAFMQSNYLLLLNHI